MTLCLDLPSREIIPMSEVLCTLQRLNHVTEVPRAGVKVLGTGAVAKSRWSSLSFWQVQVISLQLNIIT
jgi:hypothetical protein